jgi:hypothetical protein
MSELNGRGRPTKLGPKVVTKLIAAFHKGYNDDEATAYAVVSRNSYYRWYRENADFRDKIDQAKLQPNLHAKELVIDAIEGGDVNSAKWWLERKAKAEFGTRSEVVLEGSLVIPDPEAALADLDELIEWRQQNRSLRRQSNPSE